MAVPDLSWLFVLAQFFVPLYQKQVLELRRAAVQRHTARGAAGRERSSS